MSGIPFVADMVEDTMRMSTNGPFGITAARIYAEPDTFVVVNYFMREVFTGRPDSPMLARDMPVHMTVSDLRMLLRGRPPGELERFARLGKRTDGNVLFSSRNADSSMEYVLVDTSKNVLLQFQRKKSNGILELNITFGDVRLINGVDVPHTINVSFDDRKQTVAFHLTKVVVNEPIEIVLEVAIPPSFTRTDYR